MQAIRQFCILMCLTCLPASGWSHSSSSDIEWSKNKTIGINDSYAADIAVNDRGDAIAVFIHFDGSNQRVQTSIRPHGRHWETIKHFLSPPRFDAEVPQVAISPKGYDAFAIWKVHADSQYIVQAVTFNIANEGHPTFTNLTGPVDLGADPVIGVDASGNALAVWSIFDGSSYRIQSAIHYSHGHDCHDEEWCMLDEIIVDGAFNIDLAINPSGNAVIVWEGRIGFKNVIHAATLHHGSQRWVRTADVSPSNTQSNSPKVEMDKNGNAVAIWSEGVALHHIAAAKLLFGSTTWVSTSDPTSTVPSSFPDIAVDPAGNAVAVWVTFVSHSTTSVEASTLPAGSLTWSDPVILASSLVITEPQVVVDKHGNAIATWPASGFLQTSVLPFGKSWEPPQTLTSSLIGVGGQRIAMNPSGFAAITYTAQVFAVSQEIVQAVHGKLSKKLNKSDDSR